MVKIAGVQFSGHAKREHNLEKITRYVTEAARHGARVVCLPELSTSIYFCWESNYSHFDYAEPIPGPSTEEVAALAKRVGATVIFPLFERVAEGQYYNTAVIVSSRGELIGKYRKNSIPLSVAKDGRITANEKMYFQPGNLGFPVFRIPEGLTVGLMILLRPALSRGRPDHRARGSGHPVRADKHVAGSDEGHLGVGVAGARGRQRLLRLRREQGRHGRGRLPQPVLWE
jgi:hypothetical protein